jgi:sugar/nucleoside kinase (ribokinase family)
MTTKKNYDIACIGNYTKDTIVSPAGTRYVDGGAVNYAAHAVARMDLDVAVVTHLAEEDRRVIDRLEEFGVDCYVEYTQHSTLLKLEYPTQNIDQRNLSITATAGDITSEEVRHLNAKSMVIGTSLRNEISLDTIETLREKDTLLAADVQGFLRVLCGEKLEHRPWPEMEEVLSLLDILKTDGKEAEFMTGENDVVKAAAVLAEMGPREVLITHREGVLIYSGNGRKQVEFYPRQIKGRSGRGDTCLASYTGKRLSASPEEALVWAAALTSIKMENEGPFNRDIREVEQLIQRKYF